MNKKIIFIIIAVLIVILIIFGIIYFKNDGKFSEEISLSNLFPSSEEKNTNQPSGFPSGELPSGSPGGEPSGFPQENGQKGNLFQLVNTPISGATIIGTSTIRYIDKATGNIYDISFDGKDKKRITNTTILKSFDASWSKGGDRLILKYFDDTDNSYLKIKNFLALIKFSTTSEFAILNGIFLPAEAREAIISPFEDKIFYFLKTGDKYNAILADIENKKTVNISSSSFGSFLVSWPQKDKVTLLTKPSAYAEGFFYLLDLKSGKLTKLLGNIYGLIASLSPDGNYIVYSESVNNWIDTKVLNLKSGEAVPLFFRTLTDKCVWSKKEPSKIYCATPFNLNNAPDYPDNWYMGKISFNDQIWYEDVATANKDFIISDVLLRGENNIDAINLFLSYDENYLFFTNKKDNTLWGLKIK